MNITNILLDFPQHFQHCHVSASSVSLHEVKSNSSHSLSSHEGQPPVHVEVKSNSSHSSSDHEEAVPEPEPEPEPESSSSSSEEEHGEED